MDSELDFPKSLYLIQPLFNSYTLNPVNAQAQASVPLPDGLDLDVWFIPPPQSAKIFDEEGTKTKRSKKGKGKETNGAVKPKSKLKRDKDTKLLEEDVLTPVSADTDTEAERIAREQV